MRLALTRSDYFLRSEFLARTPKYHGIAKPVFERESSFVLVCSLIFLHWHPRTARPYLLLVIIYSWSEKRSINGRLRLRKCSSKGF
ncbi:hypothetical protein C1H46_032752 [Malus baccata]|uniref:Uncharacterized protein n=1 Tax=Malus baccata TaxID=106549 RepID=A0A540L5G7_MALBA|nr:hypothetical protein C1H46_032752 [Malus baccata]